MAKPYIRGEAFNPEDALPENVRDSYMEPAWMDAARALVA